jgi:oxygen-independent coproporphyrinogen-3 oxidase
MVVAPPLSLYVHLPWCVRKCPYCDFNSHVVPSAGLPERAYVAALLDDLEYAAAECAGRPLVSVFFGGGTPSLFSAEAVGRILERAARVLQPVGDLEVTLEANPGTIEHGRFAEFRAAGITRVSLGAQSFDDRHLRALGRIHAQRDTLAAVEELHAAGLVNFNLDLMYALPEQTPEEALQDLEQALVLEPAHLSHYQLTLEPGTPFAHRPPPLPDEDACWEMQFACEERLAAAGFRHYEVSAYAQPGRECRHNLNYWTCGDYLGVGAGAHGKLTDAAGGVVTRTVRHRHPNSYLNAGNAQARVAERRVVPVEDRPFEFLLNALRLVDGFDTLLFEERTGLPWSTVAGPLEIARNRGLLEHRGADRWLPTSLGRQFLNDLQAIFLPPADRPTGHEHPGPIASKSAVG